MRFTVNTTTLLPATQRQLRPCWGDAYAAIKPDLDETHHNLLNLLKGINLVMEVTPRTMDYVLSFMRETPILSLPMPSVSKALKLGIWMRVK